MCICGSLPDHNTCSRCHPAVSLPDDDWEDPTAITPTPPLPYDEEPF